jgi:hypothetical protein
MDVRQGVLERSGFKMLYLYNELAALRAEVDAAAGSSINRVQNGPLASAMRRQNELINVFAICPLKAFVEETINTRDLWKRNEAGVAFGVMETATAALLPNFQFQPQDAVRVALVSRGGAITWDERF